MGFNSGFKGLINSPSLLYGKKKLNASKFNEVILVLDRKTTWHLHDILIFWFDGAN